ncbi:MAG: SDR family oxidoreductase [Bacteroidota bacterium]
MTKEYLVVGGSSGIGLEVVKRLEKEGHRTVVLSRTNDKLQGIQNVEHVSYDVASGSDFELGLSKLDGVVYAPGTINLKPFHRLKSEDFNHDFQINVLGAVHVLQKVMPLLKKGEDASVVLFSTVAVQQGMAFHASVAASKGAVEGLARSLAAEWAPTIRVNCIAPSVTDTPLAERLLSTNEKKEASGKRHALQRVGTAEDIANLTYFLLTNESGWMTGQTLGIDGGMSTLRSF